MKLSMVRTRDGLAADSAIGEEWLEKIHPGECVMAEVKMSRNPGFHRLAFAMLQASFHNQDQFQDFDVYRQYLQIQAGLCSPIAKNNGNVWFVVDSLAFDKMDEPEFRVAYEKLLTAAVEKMGQDWLLERFG